MTQISPPPFAPGDIVTVRGQRWNVEAIAPFPDCALVQLSGIGSRPHPVACTLLYPFDRPALLPPGALRVVRPRRWFNRLRAVLASASDFGHLRASAFAEIRLYAFQLEPALAVVRELSSRFLIADEVGLGKTIQAGLMLAELRDRGSADRVLVLTPAGLRGQWAAELAHRFGIRASIMDAASLRDRQADLPAGVNPWAVEPVSIASIDFVKQPEVLRALAWIAWDALLVDEAHLAAAAPQRAAAVRALAARSRCVVLLTATPHAGDAAAFSSLCSIGRLHGDDHLMVFRRTRKAVGLGARRRVHLLPVRLTDAELRVHRLLEDYARRVWREAERGNRPAARLVSLVLTKRALSSLASLARSVERRLTLLALGPEPTFQPSLLPPPAEDSLDEADRDPDLCAAGLDDRQSERARLTEILEAARQAVSSNRKLAALRRLLRRSREPAVVFTEYRDTLDELADELQGLRTVAIVHGGLPVDRRNEAIDAFNLGAVDLLLATDAGGEGLNLHRRCRLVINLELPWNPMRLEQRIGRVDRLGQAKTVHAVHLLARDTAEDAVLTRLYRRLERIRSALGEINEPLSSPSEEAVASAVFEDRPLELQDVTRNAGSDDPELLIGNLRRDAEAEVPRLLTIRRQAAWARLTAQDSDIPVTTIRATAFRRDPELAAGPCVIWFFSVRLADAAGKILEHRVVPLRLSLSLDPMLCRAPLTGSIARQLTERLRDRLGERAQASAEADVEALARFREPAVGLRAKREQRIAELLLDERPTLVQAGLFDARALVARTRELHHLESTRAELDLRAAQLEARRTVRVWGRPECTLVLLVDGPVESSTGPLLDGRGAR